MSVLDNISHVYKGLLTRNRAFASFREKGELDVIIDDVLHNVDKNTTIFDPMSGYGGTMRYFGQHGYKTTSVELNPPAYYWQVLINPNNTLAIVECVKMIKSNIKSLPQINETLSVSDNLFSVEAKLLIGDLYSKLLNICNNKIFTIAILLPFVSRFANYQRSSSNITHFKEGGLCSYVNWEVDFDEYLDIISEVITKENKRHKELEHRNILSDILEYEDANKYSCFITSPPYPNYRDYSKLFKIENWVLDNIINQASTDFNMMIGSNNVSGKLYGEIQSDIANKFLVDLLDKSKKLTKKSQYDIKIYYHPYFCQYFYNIQEAYKKIDTLLSNNVFGYIVVNDNITRDIPIPVGASICEMFELMGYKTEDYNMSHINHYGNIGKSAKRINSHHLRHILKVWK